MTVGQRSGLSAGAIAVAALALGLYSCTTTIEPEPMKGIQVAPASEEPVAVAPPHRSAA